MTYRTQIRTSQLNELRDKVAKRSYGKYLYRLILTRVRGFSGQVVSFDFPVTALVGPNGGGKTTILGAAACAYKDIKPRQFFAKSGRFDASMKGWRLEYELVDREASPKDAVKRTASFHSRKWSRDALVRKVIVFGIARTVPAGERAELRKCASGTFTVLSDKILPISKEIVSAAQKILGRDFSKFTRMQVGPKGKVSLLAGETQGGESFSEFHFGAGESSVLRMIIETESAEENSLLLIEEIENGLHPLATMRMVEYLIDLAARKRIQTIFTTHSNEALVPLPSQAVWTSVDFRVVQGKPDILALRAITGDVEKKLVIFTEDAFAKTWIEVLLRLEPGIAPDLVDVYAMAGDGSAKQMTQSHNSDPSQKIPSVCFLDGDSPQIGEAESGVFHLPGGTPERFVFDSVREALGDQVGRLVVALHTRFEDQAKLVKAVNEVALTNLDPHLLYSQIGFKLGLVPEQTVREGFLYVWAVCQPDAAAAILAPIRDRLPRVDL